MKLYILFCLFVFYFKFGGTFFLLEAKSIYFCLKVCPLYCSKREKRDVEPYWDDDEYIPYRKSSPYIDDEVPYHEHHHPRFVYCYPYHHTTEKTTTTMATTTTESPSGICEFCEKKCGFKLPK